MDSKKYTKILDSCLIESADLMKKNSFIERFGIKNENWLRKESSTRQPIHKTYLTPKNYTKLKSLGLTPIIHGSALIVKSMICCLSVEWYNVHIDAFFNHRAFSKGVQAKT
jgi:hypothetical protein